MFCPIFEILYHMLVSEIEEDISAEQIYDATSNAAAEIGRKEHWVVILCSAEFSILMQNISEQNVLQ